MQIKALANTKTVSIEERCCHRRALRMHQVLKTTGISRTQLYRLIQAGKFPKPMKLSERISAWDEASVNAWLAEKFGEVKP
jgi:prophage regulatory protein